MKKNKPQQRKMTVRDKLELRKQIEARNKQRRREFVEKEKYNKKLFDLYVEDVITREEFEKRFKK